MSRELCDMCVVEVLQPRDRTSAKKVRNQRFLYSCQHFDHFEPDGEGPKRKVCPHSVQKCSRLDLDEIGALAIDRSPLLHLQKKLKSESHDDQERKKPEPYPHGV